MPDQVQKLHDPHPHPQERYLDLYGPHSPANSDSPLSLVVRKEEQRKLVLVDSPGRSSGFSDGSYESSPNRSPHQEAAYDTQDRLPRLPNPQNEPETEKPLSLVIRKNLAHCEDSASKYTIHHKVSNNNYNQHNLSKQTAPPKKKSDYWTEPNVAINSKNADNINSSEHYNERLVNVDEDYQDRDSGNEDSEPALVISEAIHEEEEIDQEIAHDFSTLRQRSAAIPIKELSESQKQDESTKSAGIKIKAFALPSKEEENISTEEVSPIAEADGISDLSSECASTSSVDTWSSSMIEGKPYTYGSDVVIRRISRSSNGESVYQCDFCDKLFANKYHLQSHLVTHTGERAFTCKICKKTFGRKSTLRAHMTTHTKVSNFMCTVCEKACNDNNSLEEHMRMHTGEKPFVCSICQKAYARKSHLNVHYRVHTGERPFVCEYCNKDFTEKRFLNDHMQTAHNGIDGPLKCPNCAREFAYKTSLKQHLKKQMCERNMKRAHGNLSSGSVAKQFQCPFCDKSYSWKQTLKQHVSMYHRNKVHTDEFWRYELTKNRRTIMDDKANEDLWKKQLGKHAEETAKLKLEAEAAAAAAAAAQASIVENDTSSVQTANEEKSSENNNQEENNKWLDQINRASNGQPDGENVTTEMKLLALQSLQNSLHFMSMANPQFAAMSSLQRFANLQNVSGQESAIPPQIKLENPGGPPQESYLSLLAQIAKKESDDRFDNMKTIDGDNQSKEMSSFNNNNSNNVNNNNTNGSSENVLPLLPTKEESSVKRTQMWLQQVNKYRHKPPKEELDANHEELWEQQISRVKKNPVRSPLEPVEIVIEDDSDASIREFRSNSPFQPPRPLSRHSRRSTINNNNNESITVFQTKIVLSQPAGAHGTATLSIPQQFISQPGTPVLSPKVFLHATHGNTITENQGTSSHDSQKELSDRFKTPNEKELGRPSPAQTPVPREQSPAPAAHCGEDASMLKSLLLDRMKRKRSSSIEADVNSKKSTSAIVPKVSKPVAIPEQPQDILRKRLLGWVDPPIPKASPKQERTTVPVEARRSQEPSATPMRSQARQNLNHNYGQVFQIDLNHQEEEPQRNLQARNSQARNSTARNSPARNSLAGNLPETQNQPEPLNNTGKNLSTKKETSGAKKENTVTYANTSVLKHLLHRYTEMNQ